MADKFETECVPTGELDARCGSTRGEDLAPIKDSLARSGQIRLAGNGALSTATQLGPTGGRAKRSRQ